MSQRNPICIHIDGRPLQVEPGITILQAARQHGIEIPTLCDFPGLPSPGSCRMCIVEIEGRQNTPTSCTTRVEEGMVISTHSPRVNALRADLLQMLLAEHPSGCLFCPEKDRCEECMVTLRKAGVTTGCGSCPKNGQCELQTLAEKYGVDKPVYPLHYRMIPVEKQNPFFDRDDNLCILCGRCIRACESVHFVGTLSFTQRGTHTLVGTAFHRPHLETGCTFCGSCVEVCPTGALTEKTRKWDGRPERETDATCPYCSLGCQINLLSKQNQVIGSLPNHAAGTDELCVKGRFGITELVNHPARLKQPQLGVGDFQQVIDWEEAIRTAAEKLAACPPERFEMRVSAGCTNEDLYIAGKFAREVMKSGGLTSSDLVPYGRSLGSLARLLGHSKPLEAIQEAPAVLCLGLEDPYAFPVVEAHLRRAQRIGTQIILLGAGNLCWSSRADVWLPVEPGQEVGLLRQLGAAAGPNPPAGLDGGQEKPALRRAADLLQQPGFPVILLGPAVLARSDTEALLGAVEELAHSLDARVTLLTEQANMGGLLRSGLQAGERALNGRDLDVLYLVGQAVPALPSGQPFVLYQNLFPPEGQANLLLPAAAFSEVHGTYIDYAGRVRATRQAVLPPGNALPGWMILCRIAQKMGAPGFDYTSAEEVCQAAQADGRWARPLAASPVPGWTPPGMPGEPVYMGFPLAQWVEGLRSLYPARANGSVDEPDS